MPINHLILKVKKKCCSRERERKMTNLLHFMYYCHGRWFDVFSQGILHSRWRIHFAARRTTLDHWWCIRSLSWMVLKNWNHFGENVRAWYFDGSKRKRAIPPPTQNKWIHLIIRWHTKHQTTEQLIINVNNNAKYTFIRAERMLNLERQVKCRGWPQQNSETTDERTRNILNGIPANNLKIQQKRRIDREAWHTDYWMCVCVATALGVVKSDAEMRTRMKEIANQVAEE